eukprot:4380168-Prymnesium_polylepis.2
MGSAVPDLPWADRNVHPGARRLTCVRRVGELPPRKRIAIGAQRAEATASAGLSFTFAGDGYRPQT